MCNFSHLKFGDCTTLGGGSSCCGNCGADTQKQTEQIIWEYNGHSGNLDLFRAVTTQCCPSCGKRIDGYSEVCEDGGGLDVSSWVTIPLKESIGDSNAN